jgi:hypothetical protein
VKRVREESEESDVNNESDSLHDNVKDSTAWECEESEGIE